MTFLGGRGGECLPPGIQGNFIGWQESRGRRNQNFFIYFFLTGLNHIHSALLLQTDKQTWLRAEGQELGRSNATFL